MTTDQIEVTFKCENCGGTDLELPDDYTDESIAVCKSCKTEFGALGDIKAKAIDEVKDKIVGDFQRTLRDAFKGSKFIKIK